MTRTTGTGKRRQHNSLGARFNRFTLPARKGLGRFLDALGHFPRLHRLGLMIVVPAWLVVLGWQPAPPAPEAPVTGSLSVPLSDADKRVIDVPPGGKRIDHTLTPGETLSSLFRSWQLPGQELIALIRAEPSYKPLSRLQAGQQLTLVLNADGRLHYLEIRDKGLVLNAFRRLGQEFSMVSAP
ncbi:LysM-like peptidoglycan-binding domain-containing protein [Oceanimonas sp. CHS3-5]|uniref:LysM-like peptidoglycan-binding domain-containing protein n=1 Tax=Oceanimonas sp. CHS3-5 TaxID=3068186 RepID=UPI00273D4F90|nr:LysM-like peptidoglycan-binding domain-containing protein [Oceanimonas sp. CHS3-5]MDP5292535.1 LysM-like peptidoglycan-binding domain-containing protein [Oceanimonas sp. CHS3-5]